MSASAKYHYRLPCLLALAVAAQLAACGGTTPASTAPTVALSGPQIPFQKNVSLKVGESAVIHGRRGKCGKAPPDWAKTSSELPAAKTGVFSDGGLGVRRSGRCNGLTPARGVKFTATRKGSEQIELYGDTISITVN